MKSANALFLGRTTGTAEPAAEFLISDESGLVVVVLWLVTNQGILTAKKIAGKHSFTLSHANHCQLLFSLCAQAEKRLISSRLVRWCNGNTAPFGGVIHGSNPCRTASLFFIIYTFLSVGIASGTQVASFQTRCARALQPHQQNTDVRR